MKNSILGKARWLRDVALATSKNNGARVAREWLKYAAMFVMLFTIGSGNVWADTTGEQTSFTTTSGKVNGSDDITYDCIKAGGTSAPAIKSSEIRLYQNSSTYAGGVIRIYAASGCTINSVTIGSSMATTVGYQTKEVTQSELKTAYSGSGAILAKGTKTYGGLSTTVISIACLGTSSSSRLYINKLEVTYTKAASTFTVTYNGNENTSGSVPTDEAAYNSGATVTVKENTGSLAKTGWTFAGWNTEADGSGTTYTAGTGTFTITANTTLYAKWTPIVYTVTWKVNNTTYTTGTPSTSVNHGSHVSTLPTAPNPASYCGEVFVGWTDEEYSGNSAPTPLYKTASEFPNATGDQTFYAVFADYAN